MSINEDKQLSQALQEQDLTLGVWGDEMRLQLRPSGIAVLTLNVKGGVNTLSQRVIDYFMMALDLVEKESTIKAMVITSDKPNVFVAGADIREILKLDTKESALALVDRGLKVLGRIEYLKQPIVSAIDGICLGGGLELALRTDRRVASNNATTKFALPEVTIGLVPGLGGTQKLYRLVGLKYAMEMIVSGEPISADRALEIGLVDKVTSREDLVAEAEKVALDLLASKFDRKEYAKERAAKAEEIDGGEKGRNSLIKVTARAIKIRTKGLYPAPRLAVEAIEKGVSQGYEAGLAFEGNAFADLAISTSSKNMINVYFSKEMAWQAAKRTLDQTGPVTTIGIVGGGVMGGGIAELALKNGINVVIKSSSPERSQLEKQRLEKKLEKQLAESGAPVIEVAETDDDFRPAQLIIESVYEDLDLKNKIIYELSRVIPASSVLASNTSSFAISNLSQFSNKAERVLGMHFFKPVDRMPLIEIITHQRTDEDVVKRATALAAQLGKVPLVVKDSPGFLVNRLLTHYMLEAGRMADDQIPMNWIDEAGLAFGMPIAPFHLYDELGWQLSSKVSLLHYEKFGERYAPSNLQVACSKHEKFDGKQSRFGLYLWDEAGTRLGFHEEYLATQNCVVSKEKPDEATSQMIKDRLILPMVDEAARCLEEKLVRKPREIDLAVVLGVAFPPFRGGLLRYADDLGINYVVNRLNEIYSGKKPERELSKYLSDLHRDKRRFYGFGAN